MINQHTYAGIILPGPKTYLIKQLNWAPQQHRANEGPVLVGIVPEEQIAIRQISKTNWHAVNLGVLGSLMVWCTKFGLCSLCTVGNIALNLK